MSSEALTKSHLFRVFCKQGVKAFIVQLAVMLLAIGLVFIPILNWFGYLLIYLILIVYMPWIKLVELTHLLQPGYTMSPAMGGWLLGALVYSLVWAAIKTWMERKE